MTAVRIAVAVGVVAVAVAVAALEPTRPARGAFASADDLRRFLRANAPGDGPRLPSIDYGRERAVVVSPGPRSSTGYGVEVVRVTRSGGETVVVVRESAPVLGDRVEPRVTYPYRLLAVATTDDSIGFRWLGRP